MLNVHNKIKQLRINRNMTQQQLADAISKTLSTVKKYETGQIMLNIDTLYDISKALNVDIKYFFDDDSNSLFESFIEQYGLSNLPESEINELKIEFDFMIEILIYKHLNNPNK